MQKIIFCVAILILAVFFAAPALALSDPVVYQGRYYYKVNSADPAEDTGAEVCDKAGTDYIGFTAFTTDVCKAFHPTAVVTQGVDGSKSGFYCNGPPQTGKCLKETNTCDICPACSLNVDKDTVISDQYNEMYVECGAPLVLTGQANPDPGFKPDILSSLNSAVRLRLLGISWQAFDKDALKRYADGKVACDFYQPPLGNRFYGYCSAPNAIDNFCKIVMGSLDAKKEFCGTSKDGPLLDGLIVCSLPCPASSGKALPVMTAAHCAYDPARSAVRSDDKPLSFCTGSTSSASGTAAAPARMCPNGCFLRSTGLGAAGTGYINCEVNYTKVYQAADSCTGTETHLSIDPQVPFMPCACSAVEPSGDNCPDKCGASGGSVVCQVSSIVSGKSGRPCDGTIQGTTNQHCWCIKKGGSWQIGPENGTSANTPATGTIFSGSPASGGSTVTIKPPTIASPPKLIASTTGAAGTTTTAAEAPKLCPSACYKRATSLGPAGTGYINCEIDPRQALQPLSTCTGTETVLSIDKNVQPVACSCPAVQTVNNACPSQCGSGSNTCFVDSNNYGKKQVPCGGKVPNTVTMHCTCVYKDGDWKFGSDYQVF